MKADEFDLLLRELQRAGWIVQRSSQRLPAQLLARYPWLPEDVRSFLSTYEMICRADQKMWLLLWPDYAGVSDAAFRWNEWELQSLDAVGSDEAERREIVAFWDRHMPIALSVDDGYGYYALRADGVVVTGREPEFVEATPIATSFREFLASLD
jgi:hypothetical protein